MTIPYLNWNLIEEKAQSLNIVYNNVQKKDNSCTVNCKKPDGSFGCCPYTNGNF